jgi:hypothetical protein
MYSQNYWIFLLFFPSSGILENIKHDVSETGSISVLRWRGDKTPTQLGPLERANPNHFALSKGPSWVGVSCSLTWGRKQFQFPKRCGHVHDWCFVQEALKNTVIRFGLLVCDRVCGVERHKMARYKSIWLRRSERFNAGPSAWSILGLSQRRVGYTTDNAPGQGWGRL